MKQNSLLAAWAILFIICAVLGFIPGDDTLTRGIAMLFAASFFVPPVILLWDARKQSDKKIVALIRSLSAASLILTLVLMIANIRSALASEVLGNFLHGLLGAVSVPMYASHYWAASLFLWACLLFGSILKKN